MQLKELSVLAKRSFDLAALQTNKLAAAYERASREMPHDAMEGLGAATVEVTLAFLLLHCRLAQHGCYEAIQKVAALGESEREQVANATRHLLLPGMSPDAIEQAAKWLAEMRRIAGFGLKRRARPRPGDVFAIPLFNGMVSYAQVAGGGGVLVLDRQTSQPATVADLEGVGTRFGPVKVGYGFLAKEGPWYWVGALTMRPAKSPGYVGRSFYSDEHDRMRFGSWYAGEAGSEKLIGDTLPERYRDYELDWCWPAFDLEQRIVTGRLGSVASLAYGTEPWFNEG